MFIEAIILGFFLIALTKGSWQNIKNFHFQKFYLPAVGIFVFLFSNYCTSHSMGKLTDFTVQNYTYLHLLSLALIIIGLCMNGKIRSMYVIACGFFCNFIAIAANGKMPVSKEALLKASSPYIRNLILSGNSLSHGIFDHPKLYYLSDIIPISKPYYAPKVISFGDIIITIGLVFVLLEIARGKDNGSNS